jgi:biotin carboxylase
MAVAEAPGTKRRVLLLAPATSYRIGDFLDAARALDVSVTVGSDQRQTLEALSDGGTMTVDLADRERGVARIVEAHRDRPIAAIVAVDEEATMLAATASAALGLAHNAPEAVAAAGNKHLMRLALRDAGLASPGFFIAALADGPEAARRNAVYPCVLKPLSLSASRGVIRVDDDAALEAAFLRVAAIVRPASDHILIEDYVPGAEVALEALLQNGRLRPLALFDKPDPLEGPFFEETIYVTPSRLADAVQRAISETVARAAAALGLRDGPIHAELRLPPGDRPGDRPADPVVIDIAARSIGGLCARALRFGAGIGLEELILRHALDLPIEALEREAVAAGVMMIPIPRAGVLGRVGGRDDARAVAAIEALTITIPIGQEVVPLPEGNRYLGFIFARGETAEIVEYALRDAHRRLDIEIVAPVG